MKRLIAGLPLALACVFMLSSCSLFPSSNTAQVARVSSSEVRVTALQDGLLTAASTEVITKISGADIGNCILAKTFKGDNHGLICNDIKNGFTITLETLGTVAARVTNMP